MVITHEDVDFTSNTFTFEALFLFGVGNYMRQQVASYNKNYVALELCLINVERHIGYILGFSTIAENVPLWSVIEKRPLSPIQNSENGKVGHCKLQAHHLTPKNIYSH